MRRNSKEIIHSLFIFSVLSLVLSVSAIFLNVPLEKCIRFSLYQVFLIFLPGTALTVVLFKHKEFTYLSFLFISYALGYAVNILEYFLLVFVGISGRNANCISVSVCVAALLYACLVKHTTRFKHFSREDLLWGVLFSLLIFVLYFAYSANCVIPSESNNSAFYHKDGLYWVENAAALKLAFPPPELRCNGMKFYYHYFSGIHLAFSSLVTGIDLFSLAYPLYVLTRALIVFGGAYTAAHVIIRNNYLRYIFVFALLFSTGLEKYTEVHYIAQLIYIPMGFDLALGYGAYVFALMFDQDRKKFNLTECICTALAMLMAAGHKAPLALIFMAFAGVICLKWLLKKEFSKVFIYGFALIAVFSFVMIVCIGVFNPAESGNNAGEFGINANLRNTRLYAWHEHYRMADATSFSEIILSLSTWALAMGCMLLAVNPFILLVDAICVFKMTRNRSWDFFNSALLISALFGTCMGMFTLQSGMSQMYYSMASFLPGLLLGLKDCEISKRKASAFCAVAAGFLLLIQSEFFLRDVLDFSLQKFQTLCAGGLPSPPENGTDYPYAPDSIQYADYKALEWIRENTPADSIIISDRDICLEQRTYMYHGTFCERQMYLEGECYLYGMWDERDERRDRVRWIFLNDEDAFLTVKEEGADYIVQTKWIRPDYQGHGCTLVYETDTINVWKIDQ